MKDLTIDEYNNAPSDIQYLVLCSYFKIPITLILLETAKKYYPQYFEEMNKPDRPVTTFPSWNGKPIHSLKVQRNEPCPCGSGIKAKKCCGATTQIFKSE
jgi:uncharacterized protein YecA (UPF0149 family)